jgi:hypothetical protein
VGAMVKVGAWDQANGGSYRCSVISGPALEASRRHPLNQVCRSAGVTGGELQTQSPGGSKGECEGNHLNYHAMKDGAYEGAGGFSKRTAGAVNIACSIAKSDYRFEGASNARRESSVVRPAFSTSSLPLCRSSCGETRLVSPNRVSR